MQNFSKKDMNYIKRCLELATKGKGYTKLNPLVGCVIVHDDRIIGEGFYEKYGGPHAEVNAINDVKEEDQKLLSESTLYVSLEPCNIFGKTPPCTNLIEEKKIPNVVIGMLDPNPKVFRNGVKYLEDLGVNVKVGILEKEGQMLNKVFIKNQKKRLPYVTLKWAQSADGYMGKKGERIQISNKLSQRLSHQLRKEHDAILIGYNTVLTDNPKLTDRFFSNSPIRVVLDDQLELPDHLNIFNQKDDVYTLVVNNKKQDLSDGHVKFLKIKKDENFVDNLLKKLYQLEIGNVLVEGGQQTLQLFIDSKFWDEVYVFQSQQILQSDLKSPKIEGIPVQSSLGDNQVIRIKPIQ